MMLEKVKKILSENEYTCAMTDGKFLFTSRLRGVKPLVQLMESGNAPRGLSAADKVVGKATAWMYVMLGVQELYAAVISEPAALLLESYGITVVWGTLVPNIINRRGDGICPFEEAVMGIADPESAYGAIREKMRELNI